MHRIAVLAAIAAFAVVPSARAGFVGDTYEDTKDGRLGRAVCEELGPYGEFLDNADEPWRTAGDLAVNQTVGCDEDGSDVVRKVDRVTSWFECTAEAQVQVNRKTVAVCLLPEGEAPEPEPGPAPEPEPAPDQD